MHAILEVGRNKGLAHMHMHMYECEGPLSYKGMLCAGILVEFENELALGPRVLREWFCQVFQELFNPGNALFIASPIDWRRFFPNPEQIHHFD
ncbi:E3 ubiquitin-protein ligase UPL5 [Acorus calamus]|uniref:HECT-type E3 ubiquitin transferase n=1 Tax=Acorus calamus TaxID=4465 RepID=A0AAV9CTC1_ACOCL|nr:E3 ubiquitin-protein ligase UPL5 [Acorus calamus]